MPGPLSETVSPIMSCSVRTSMATSGRAPAVSDASKALSTSSLRQTLANSVCPTPVSAESCLASKYSEALETSNVVRCSLAIRLCPHCLSHIFLHLAPAKRVAQNHSSHGCAQWLKVRFRILAVDLELCYQPLGWVGEKP